MGRNLQIDARFAGGDPEKIRRYVAELVALGPDVILTAGGTILGPLIQATRAVPIVFASSVDPVGAGFVERWRGRGAMSQASPRSISA